MQYRRHPAQAFFAPREPGLSEAEGDLGEPRGASRSLRRINRAFSARSPLHCEPEARISSP